MASLETSQIIQQIVTDRQSYEAAWGNATPQKVEEFATIAEDIFSQHGKINNSYTTKFGITSKGTITSSPLVPVEVGDTRGTLELRARASALGERKEYAMSLRMTASPNTFPVCSVNPTKEKFLNWRGVDSTVVEMDMIISLASHMKNYLGKLISPAAKA